jgi:hypothetical protein
VRKPPACIIPRPMRLRPHRARRFMTGVAAYGNATRPMCASGKCRRKPISSTSGRPSRPNPEAGMTKKGSLLDRGVDFLAVDPEFRKRQLDTLLIELSIAGQSRQCRRRNRLGIDFKMPPQVLAVIAAPEAIGA